MKSMRTKLLLCTHFYCTQPSYKQLIIGPKPSHMPNNHENYADCLVVHETTTVDLEVANLLMIML